jgi:hypothetical protein
MKLPSSSTGLPRPIPLDIPADWTPEQALAVVELLDDLRERIWVHYDVKLFELLREQCLPGRPRSVRCPMKDSSLNGLVASATLSFPKNHLA